ncbi:hypothetical protein ACX80Z_14030 [Arthrobacter sp. TMT4-20]
MTVVVVPDPETLSRGWSDWILFAEVQEQLRERGSKEEVSDSITWAVLHQHEGYVRPGVILPDRVEFWSDSGADLSSRMQTWLDFVPPDDPQGPAMNLFFEITDRAMAIIPEELQF